jgi:hypothetical protein
VPFKISARISQQDNLSLLAMAGTGVIERSFVQIELRGNVYNCIINGSTVTATPSDTRVSLNLFAADLSAFFVLDDGFYGRLQDDGPPAFNNKLGF